MRDLVGGEKRDPSQARAICESYWDGRNKKKGGGAGLPFNLELFQHRIWCIHPSKLDEINLFVEKSLTGEFKITQELIEAKYGEDGDRAEDEYEVIDGVAVLPVYGTIGKKMNLMSMLSGGTSTDILKRNTQLALADDSVEGILLDINSPGGVVEGTKEYADFLYSVRGQKPIIAHTGNQMTSAAYWIGSAADKIIAFDTAEVGSIGVRTVHYDYSKRLEDSGVVKTDIYTGKYKALLTDAKPLSDEGREYLQEMVDKYFKMFVESVGKNLNLSFDDALKLASDSKVFLAQDALSIGMIHEIGTFEKAIETAKAWSVGNTSWFIYDEGGDEGMNLKELREKYPDLVAQIEKDAIDGAIAQFAQEKAELQAQMADLKTLMTDIQDQNKKLEKENTVRTLAEQNATAESIWTKQLSESSLDPSIHDKVRLFVTRESHMKDGDFDREGFEKAVKAEIFDWEGRFTAETSVVGGGSNQTKVADQPEDEDTIADEQVKKMLAGIGQVH